MAHEPNQISKLTQNALILRTIKLISLLTHCKAHNISLYDESGLTLDKRIAEEMDRLAGYQAQLHQRNTERILALITDDEYCPSQILSEAECGVALTQFLQTLGNAFSTHLDYKIFLSRQIGNFIATEL